MARALRQILLVLILALPALGQSAAPPPLSLRDLNGRRVSLQDFKGKVVLINFWATWCPPCRAEIPDLIKMQRDYGRHGLQVIGITYPPQRIGEVRSFSRKFKINYPVAIGRRATKALFDKSEILPVTIVIDREGNIRDRIEGILLPDEFEQKIKPLL